MRGILKKVFKERNTKLTSFTPPKVTKIEQFSPHSFGFFLCASAKLGHGSLGWEAHSPRIENKHSLRSSRRRQSRRVRFQTPFSESALGCQCGHDRCHTDWMQQKPLLIFSDWWFQLTNQKYESAGSVGAIIPGREGFARKSLKQQPTRFWSVHQNPLPHPPHRPCAGRSPPKLPHIPRWNPKKRGPALRLGSYVGPT